MLSGIIHFSLSFFYTGLKPPPPYTAPPASSATTTATSGLTGLTGLTSKLTTTTTTAAPGVSGLGLTLQKPTAASTNTVKPGLNLTTTTAAASTGGAIAGGGSGKSYTYKELENLVNKVSVLFE